MGNRSANATIAVMRAGELLNKLHDEPFQPFRARLSNNTVIDILDPNTVVVGPGSAITPIETIKDSSGYYVVSRWRTVALSHIIEFVDIGPPTRGTKQKRAS